MNSTDPLDLSGRRNIVTGATLRLGRAMSICFVGLIMVATAAGAATPALALTVEEAGDVEQEIPREAGRSVGSPDAGPDPQHSGDRGGSAQLVTLGVLASGVGFIMWRIFSATKQTPGSAADE